MNDYTMVIPTYWGRSGADLIDSETKVFDHPTPLDQEGTLGRLLDSLSIFDNFQGHVVIITVANDPDIAPQVKDRVDEIIEPYRDRFRISNLDRHTLDQLRPVLKEKGLPEESLGLLNLDNYSAVRNMCSLAGILNNSAVTIFIDDDEIFIDPLFLEKVSHHIQKDFNGEPIRALAGYYLQPDTWRLDVSKVPSWRASHWNNAVAMNEAFEKIIGSEPRLKITPFVFGGNMTLTLDTIKATPFDPKITRGEDIDFLINLRIHGVNFYLDRELSIKHLPPGSSRPVWKKVREDILRFLYEQKKVNDHDMSLDDLQPYPAPFLDADLEERIVKTNELLKKEYEESRDEEGVRECEENIRLAQENPFRNFDPKAWLKQLTAQWQQLTTAAQGLGIPQ